MTIQEIIDNRVAEIAFLSLLCPYMEHHTKKDMEFLAWMQDKFPKEYVKARWAMHRGETPYPIKPSRQEKFETRKNHHRWYR